VQEQKEENMKINDDTEEEKKDFNED